MPPQEALPKDIAWTNQNFYGSTLVYWILYDSKGDRMPSFSQYGDCLG